MDGRMKRVRFRRISRLVGLVAIGHDRGHSAGCDIPYVKLVL